MSKPSAEESPQTFKGGQVWGVMTGKHLCGALQAIGPGCWCFSSCWEEVS